MRKNRINTTSIREINHSFKRFLSLLVMSMLGVGVFVGIKMSAPDMMASLDKYYDDNNFYDIKLVSTLGLTKNDKDALEKIENVKSVYLSNSKDVIVKTNKDEIVIKLIGINDNVNKIKIINGKKPTNNNEIIVEEAMLKREKLKIGDTINIEDDSFKEKNLKIVGSVKSPLYINSKTGATSRGNTTIGSGKINYYTYVNNDNFNLDYYTEIYVTATGAKKYLTNSKEYNKLINSTLNNIKEIKKEREDFRYNEIYNKYKEEIDKKQKEGQEKLDSAKKLLDSNKQKLIDAKERLDSTKKTLDESFISLNDNKIKLSNAKNKLDNNKILLDNASKTLEDAENKMNDKLSVIGITFDDIEKAIDYLNDFSIPKSVIIDSIPSDTPGYVEIVNAINNIYDLGLEEKFKDFIKSETKKDDLINLVPTDTPYYDDIINTINYISDKENIDKIKDFINNDVIDKVIKDISPDTPYYEEIINTLTYFKEHSGDIEELISGIKEIRNGKEEYKKSLEMYNSYKEEYDKGYMLYLNYYDRYQNGMNSYNEGIKRYDSSLSLYNSKLKEYYESKNMFDSSIKEAIDKLGSIPKATLYTYERLDDSGYSSFIDDGNSVSNLSKVFPTIFFVVAILISLISMSRMVEDDRGVIGTFKSLGFSNKHIRKKYLLYSGIATISGGVLGSLLGFFFLPKFVWNIYKILFDVPVFKYDYNPTNVIVGIILATICICGTTLITIRKVVREKPSDLMRPKAPSSGKRVLLEKVPFIWNHINFSNKITARNLFRYKKRVFMTIGGIIGCTALMLTGFGIKDSILEIPEKQYKNVFNFDELIYLTGSNSKEKLDDTMNSKHIVKRLDTNMTLTTKIEKYDVNLFVPDNEKDMDGIISLKDVKSKKKLYLEDNKVIISDKLSDLTKKRVGDEIEIIYPDNKTYKFIVSGVCENYVSNYVFMNKKTYESNIDKYESNISYLKLDNLKYENKLSTALLKNDNVMSIMSVNQTIKGVNNMLKSLNNVVAILIFLSGALSFVVLYNLSYINITERKREIATLKVLGFTNKEVDDYIIKETIILTLLGIIFGLVFGIFLTNVILDTVEIEVVRFIHHIKFYSYIKTSLLVMLFTIIVSILIHFALKKIDMIESLKSVE